MQSFARSVSHNQTVVQELALSVQLSGSPAARSLFDATMRTQRIENVCVQIGSQHISSMPAIRPELSKAIFSIVAQGVKSGAQGAAESGSKVLLWHSSLFQLSSKLESFLMSTKPGFVLLPGGSRGVPAIELHHVLVGNKIDITKLDLTNLPLHLYDEAICSGEKLQKLATQFKNTPGALGNDGPLQKVLEMGYVGADPGCQGTVRGALYELEVASKLENAGESICAFGTKYKGASIGYRDFDVDLGNRLIECKNINWDGIRNVTGAQTKFAEQNKIALEHGKVFQVYSKQSVPECWKDWFNKKNISFKEG